MKTGRVLLDEYGAKKFNRNFLQGLQPLVDLLIFGYSGAMLVQFFPGDVNVCSILLLFFFFFSQSSVTTLLPRLLAQKTPLTQSGEQQPGASWSRRRRVGSGARAQSLNIDVSPIQCEWICHKTIRFIWIYLGYWYLII